MIGLINESSIATNLKTKAKIKLDNKDVTNFYDFTPNDIEVIGYPRVLIKEKNPGYQYLRTRGLDDKIIKTFAFRRVSL